MKVLCSFLGLLFIYLAGYCHGAYVGTSGIFDLNIEKIATGKTMSLPWYAEIPMYYYVIAVIFLIAMSVILSFLIAPKDSKEPPQKSGS